jgi:hypothetical protein
MYLVPAKSSPVAKPQAASLEDFLGNIPYKRITDQIRRYWGKDYCDEYLNSLLINDRDGDRQGFPPEIAAAIFGLITLNELMRRRAGAVSEAAAIDGNDWANETGKWTIVKSPETKKAADKIEPASAVAYAVVKS